MNASRDTIFEYLVNTYSRDSRGLDWWTAKGSYSTDMCKHVTTEILSKIVDAHYRYEDERQRYEQRTLFNEIFTIIWINFPGGTTAEAVTTDICNALGIPGMVEID